MFVGLLSVDSYKDLGIIVNTELKFHRHIRTIVRKSSGMSVNLLSSTLCRLVHVSGHGITGKCAETMAKIKVIVLKIIHIFKD